MEYDLNAPDMELKEDEVMYASYYNWLYHLEHPRKRSHPKKKRAKHYNKDWSFLDAAQNAKRLHVNQRKRKRYYTHNWRRYLRKDLRYSGCKRDKQYIY